MRISDWSSDVCSSDLLPGLSINMGGATSIDITREGVDKAYGLKKLRDASGIALDAMMFIGDAIFPGGNDYPAKELGLDTVRVSDPQETLSVIDAIVACQKPHLDSNPVR